MAENIMMIYAYAFVDVSKLQDINFSVAIALNAKGNEAYSAAVDGQGKYINMDSTVDSTYILHDPRLAVEMPYVKKGSSSANANGWLRSDKFYFNELLKNHPDAFSSDNIQRISEGHSPVVDNHFTSVFPQFEPFKNMNLIHHHVGEGSQAVAMPKAFHIGTGGIHNIEKELGITQSEHLFADYYTTNYLGTDVPQSEIRENFLKKQIGERWETALVRGNEAAYQVNAPERVRNSRRYNSELKRVLSVPSAYPSAGIGTGGSLKVDVQDFNVLAQLGDGIECFCTQLRYQISELDDALCSLSSSYRDEGYNILFNKVQALDSKLSDMEEQGKALNALLESKIQNILRQISLASEE